MACSLSATLTAACSSGIGKLNNRVGLLKVIAQTFASRLPANLSSNLSEILSRACTSGIGKENNPLTLLRIIAQNICNQNSGVEPMAFTDLANTATVSAGSGTFTTDASYTPDANALALAFVMTTRPSIGQSPPDTVTGNGMTWTLIDSQSNTSGTRFCISVWKATSSAPVAGNLTVTMPSADNTSCILRVVQFTNVDVSSAGANAIVQSSKNLVTGANPTITLTNPINTSGKNAVIGFSGCVGTTYGATAEAGWNLIFDAGTSDSMAGTGTYQLASVDQSVSLTKAASARYAFIAMEIKSKF